MRATVHPRGGSTASRSILWHERPPCCDALHFADRKPPHYWGSVTGLQLLILIDLCLHCLLTGPHARVLTIIQFSTVVKVHQLVSLLTGAWRCPHDPLHRLARPSPANLREAETGESFAFLSACAGNGGICSTAARLPPQFRDLSFAQAGSTWDITNNCSADQRAEDGTPGYDSSASLSRCETARLDPGRAPRCASTPLTSSPQHETV